MNHDGIDDIIEVGSANSGADGQPIFDTELGHGDRFHITDMDPDRPGLETYSIQQLNPTLLATMLYESGSGKIIKKWYGATVTDVGRGVALAMDPNRKGCEMFSTQPGIYDCKGNQIYANNMWAPETVWWDGDLLRELGDFKAARPLFESARGSKDGRTAILAAAGAAQLLHEEAHLEEALAQTEAAREKAEDR